jgi:hypothetical protein
MGRPMGMPKTGGRQSGTPNRNTCVIQEKLQSLGCDPIAGLAKIALESSTPLELKVRCLTELAQYVYPKRKAIDVSLEQPTRLRAVVEHIGSARTSEPIVPHQADHAIR